MLSGTTVNFIVTGFSIVSFTFIAIWYIYPRLKTQATPQAFVPLVWVHVFRTVGMMALAPGMAAPEVPLSVYTQMAFGDLITAALALITLVLIRYQRSLAVAIASVWIINLFGFIDVIHAMNLAMRHGLAGLPMGPMWYVAVIYVPMIIVSHVLIFILLLKRN